MNKSGKHYSSRDAEREREREGEREGVGREEIKQHSEDIQVQNYIMFLSIFLYFSLLRTT